MGVDLQEDTFSTVPQTP